MKVFIPAMREVVKKYNIKFDPETPCPWDDDLTDRIYQAALEFYSKVGTYCVDTERVIRFTKEEIEEAVYECPKEAYFGEGPDRVVFRGRKPDDNTLFILIQQSQNVLFHSPKLNHQIGKLFFHKHKATYWD